MIDKKGYKSWTISEELWEKAKPLIPEYQREEGREYKRKPGGGRKPPDKRGILEAIIYVSGCQWKSIPKWSNVHRYFQLWLEAGFFLELWKAGLYEYDELKGLEWEWQSLDGCNHRWGVKLWEQILRTGEKNGTKRSVLTEGKGIPLSVVIDGANVHDVRLLTLENIVIFRPVPTEEEPQNLCLDAGFTGYTETVISHRYIPHIRPRGEEKMEIERNPDFKARRWVVEVSHSSDSENCLSGSRKSPRTILLLFISLLLSLFGVT